jgi:hypothetical protein
MSTIERLICDHDYERQSVYVDTGELVKKCRNCGKRVSERRPTPSRPAT